MTEAEKRALALQFMEQEQQRLASTSFIDHKHAAITDLHHEFATRQQYYDAFAQQGITFRRLRARPLGHARLPVFLFLRSDGDSLS